MVVGVLALQGDFAEHINTLSRLEVSTMEVRNVTDLTAVDSIIIPGGESTVIMKLLKESGLDTAIQARVQAGMPIFGTCAGAIVLSNSHLKLLDIDVDRNAYGSQLQSFSTEVDVQGIGTVPVEFIRAPKISNTGASVEVLSTYNEDPVVVRSGNILACTCHTETTGSTKLHEYFLQNCAATSVVQSAAMQ